jgi:hypothetical protein
MLRTTYFAFTLLFASTLPRIAQANENIHQLKADHLGSLKLPCKLQPSLNLLAGSIGFFTQEQLASAAWFARAVQLPESERNEHWNSLSEQPVSIKDIYAGPFGLHSTVLEFDHDVLVLYRGTQDALDYVLNGVFFTTPGWFHRLPGWVHQGFLTNFKLSARKLLSNLKKHSEAGKAVSFAAHSLGGVLSQYAAWRAEAMGVKVGRVYAFQAPNGGDVHFKRKFDQKFSGRSVNVIYGDDLTPHIPPTRAAGKSFASATSKPLAGVLRGVVHVANYGTLGGRYILSKDGLLREVLESDLQSSENEYWNNYRKITGGVGFPRGLGKESSIVKDHNISTVTCALASSLH